jgi:hypothetical protein
MKNLIAFAISICFLLVFVGCESAMNVKTKQEADLLIVMEVSDTHIICGTDTAKYSIPNWFKDKNIQPNEFIKIYHNGIVLELWPMQFAKIDAMEYISPTGEIHTVTKDTVEVNTVFVEQYDSVIPLKKKLSNDDATFIMSCLKDLPDETEYICNCIPDYQITIDNTKYAYCSNTGLITELYTRSVYVANKEDINPVLLKYLGGIMNGN